MNWRAILAVALAAGLALQFVPAYSQGSSPGVANVSVKHYYIVTSYGFGVLNDSFTFSNPSNSSTATIPTINVALPSRIASRTLGVVLSPSDQFTVTTSAASNGTNVATIAPVQPTLQAGQSVTVALKAVLDNIMNYTSATGYTSAAKILVLLSPGLDTEVTSMRSTIILPVGGQFQGTVPGFGSASSNSTTPSYVRNQTSIQPTASAEYLNFTDPNQSSFTPLTVNSLVRTIVPSANGTPMVEDYFSLHSLASYSISQIHLYLLNPSLTQVNIVPGTDPPLLNPQLTPLGSGQIAFADNSLGSNLLANSNFSLTVQYALPRSMLTISGNTVTVKVPYSPVIAAACRNYSIILAPVDGIVPKGPTRITDQVVTPFTPGTVDFTYSVSFGWAADKAIPAGLLVFAVAFAMFAIQRPSGRGEESEVEEKGIRLVKDVLNAFEEKTGLEEQYVGELAGAKKGAVGKGDFDKMRNEISDLRSRALQRLTEMRQDLGSGRQFDVLGRVADAEKEEDRAYRDLLNLYQQYLGNKMNDETFKRLQPNYKKRLDSAINRLSDLLHETQTEER